MQRLINQTFILFIVSIAAGLIYLLAPILTPFLAGTLFAYLAEPLVVKLKKWHVPHFISVVIVFFFIFSIIVLIILLLIPLVQQQIALLVDVVPKMINWIETKIIPWVTDQIGLDELMDMNTIKSSVAAASAKLGGALQWLLKTVLKSSATLILWITNLVLIPVVAFYLLRDWEAIIRGIRDWLPRSIEPTVVAIIRECDEVLSSFFRGQLLVMLSLGVIYGIGLTLIGLQIGLIIGLIAGLLSIVPYLGCIVGILIASIAAIVQFGTIKSIILVLSVFLIGQGTESFILTPYLVGNRIGLHPVAVIFAILAGGTLFGFFGVLLALPAAAVIMVLIRFIDRHYRASKLYSHRSSHSN